MLISPKIHMLKTDAQRDGILMRLWEVTKSGEWSPHEWGRWPYRRYSWGLPYPFTIWWFSKQMATVNQEVGPQQTMNTLAHWPWTSQPLEVWEIHFCFLQATQPMVIWYSSLNRLTVWCLQWNHPRGRFSNAVSFANCTMHILLL